MQAGHNTSWVTFQLTIDGLGSDLTELGRRFTSHNMKAMRVILERVSRLTILFQYRHFCMSWMKLRARSSQRGNLDVPSDQAVVITLWFERCIRIEVRFRPCTSFLISQSLTCMQYMNYVKNTATTWRIRDTPSLPLVLCCRI